MIFVVMNCPRLKAGVTSDIAFQANEASVYSTFTILQLLAFTQDTLYGLMLQSNVLSSIVSARLSSLVSCHCQPLTTNHFPNGAMALPSRGLTRDMRHETSKRHKTTRHEGLRDDIRLSAFGFKL